MLETYKRLNVTYNSRQNSFKNPPKLTNGKNKTELFNFSVTYIVLGADRQYYRALWISLAKNKAHHGYHEFQC